MSAISTQDNDRSRQGRIPATLQAVFLASNRGREVNKPPPAKVASKVFFRNWLFQRQAKSKEKGGIEKKKKVESLHLQPAVLVACFLAQKARFIGEGIFTQIHQIRKADVATVTEALELIDDGGS